MDNTCDLGKLDFSELLELQSIQRKMQDVTGAKVRHRRSEQEPEEPEDLARLTLEELRRLHRLYLKMANEPYSWERASVHLGADGKWYYKNGEPYTWDEPGWKHVNEEECRKTPGTPYIWEPPPGYVPVIPPWYSGVTAVLEPAQPAEAVAVAPATAPVKPVTPATPAPAEKPKLPSDSVVSAARQLDSILRFGV